MWEDKMRKLFSPTNTKNGKKETKFGRLVNTEKYSPEKSSEYTCDKIPEAPSINPFSSGSVKHLRYGYLSTTIYLTFRK